jgi:ATP-dependent DNA helicase DinG
VAASATLALGGRFDIVARSWGLNVEHGRTPEKGDVRSVEPPQPDEDDPDKQPPPVWRALDVGSPFDYPKQGILYVAARLPRPGMSGLSDQAKQEFVELVEASGGRTLGLFSSRRAAQSAAEALRAATDIPVLLQGDDSIHLLMRRFREEPQTCLLGVASLWQGVDVPGDACHLVVIDRLPFPRPDEPLTAARSKAVDDSGGSGFMAVSVPAAAIRLAQGAGRLIRAAGDRGVVAVLDPRLQSARYGEFIRRTLPPFWYTTSPDVVRGALGRLREGAENRAQAAV